ncbi:MAG: T9SS type A sorting domain-containing protein, partial [Candidatus Kapaibacteriota bacterium]
ATAEPSRNVITLKEFIYPETIVAGPFKIHKPKIQTNKITLPPGKIFYQAKYEFQNNICNVGDVPLKIESAYFLNGKNFSLGKDLGNDTLGIGSCLPLEIVFNPKDTGVIYDTLVIVSCGERYFVPVSAFGLNRNFKFLSEVLDFGSVCVDEEREYEIELGINDDTLDLPINIVRIQPSGAKHFTILEGNQYQVLSPKQKLMIKIRFHPREIGTFNTYLEIFYLGQWDYVFRIPVRGEGIGAKISTSTDDLRFIPEIPIRDITLKNLSAVDVTIDSIVFNPPNYFLVNASVPFTLRANSARILSFTMLDIPPSDVQATFYASPCAVNATVTMGNYTGTSTISFPQIETPPKGTVAIPIEFKNTENKPYNGKRFFEAEFSLDKRMFLPLSIETEFGSAKIIKQEILGDKRIIGIRVEGDFPQDGILAKIVGNVGLGESDVTSIDFNTQSNFWGKNVLVEYLSGSLRLVDLCGNRRIKVEDSEIKNLNISPNPANETITLGFQTQYSGLLQIEIFDVVGNLHFSERYFINEGEYHETINISFLPNGLYRLVLKIRDISSSIEFIVFKP